MNRKEAEDILNLTDEQRAIIKAFVDGNALEFYDPINSKWIQVCNPSFDFSRGKYRIRSEDTTIYVVTYESPCIPNTVYADSFYNREAAEARTKDHDFKNYQIHEVIHQGSIST